MRNRKWLLGRGLLGAQERVQSESYPECELSANIQLLSGWAMIRFHIDSIRNRGMIFKLERFSHLSD